MRLAAAVLLSCGDQVWLGRRGRSRFLPGFWVFPGGAGERGESAEETARREVLEESGLDLGGRDLAPFARAITPPYSPMRFDAYIFHCELEQPEPLKLDDNELVEGRWDTVEVFLQDHRHGRIQLAPPTLNQLELWQACREGRQPWPSREEAFRLPSEDSQIVLPMAPQITLLPARSPAMPPAAWTNIAILGERNLYVVDPGGVDPQPLQEELLKRQEGGAELKGVLLTHHHPDHIAGYLSGGFEKVPLYAHSITAALLPRRFPAAKHLGDGTRLSLEEGLSVLAHHTPGHAPGHLCFEIPERSTLIAGDLISSLSSIVIPSDNGDLDDYLQSLSRMRALDCNLILCSHGPPYGRGSDPFGEALAHRFRREEQVLNVLHSSATGVTLEDITKTLYRGLSAELFPAARANVGHHLKRLLKNGQARLESERWKPVGA